jgi:hypothetical protein
MTTPKYMLVLPVAALLLMLPGAAQAQCGGYGPQGWWCAPSCGGYGPQDPRCYGRRGYRSRYEGGYYDWRDREERRERRRERDYYWDRRDRY